MLAVHKARLALGSLLALAALCALASWAGSAAPATAAPATVLPPIRHVWVINLENTSYSESFGAPTADPYLASVLTGQGVLIQNYWGIGHNSADNYIAQISGQAPNPDTQTDCAGYPDFTQGAPINQDGQAVGRGCVFPTGIKTLPDQLEAQGLTWKGYMQDMGKVATNDGGYTCAHPPLNGSDSSDLNVPDKYATKHNPFVFFHTIVDDPARCRADVVPMDDMFTDLQSVGTTPNFSYITPNMCDDGHDACSAGYTFDGTHGGLLDGADKFSAWLLPQIFASPAYRQDGMVILTYDESDVVIGTGVPAGSSHNEDTSCCNEVPGPNSPDPGIGGPGGGQVGAVLVSPFIRPGTTTATATPVAPNTAPPDAYNHYSMLRSLEDLFGITTGGADAHGHLGYAAKPMAAPGDPGSFGNDVYNLPAVTAHPSPLKGIAPPDATPGQQPVGPRPASASSAWEAPGPQGNGLNAITCPSVDMCIAVGDAGTVLVRDTGGSWTFVRTGISDDLLGVDCTPGGPCVAVGRNGAALTSTDGGRTWSSGAPASSRTLRAVSCPSSAICVAVGDNGTIERSDDGGTHWSTMSTVVTGRLAAVDCPSTTTCYASGGETVPLDLKSTDGGRSWTNRGASSDVTNGTGVACATDQRCAISAPDNTVRWTTDGTNWTKTSYLDVQKPHDASRFLGVSCPTSTVCYLAADRGGIFKLDETAQPVTLSTAAANVGDNMNGISCPSAAACFAVGDEGQILSTSDGGKTWTSERTGLVPKKPGDGSATSVGTLRAASCDVSGACVAVGDSSSVATLAAPNGSWVSHSDALPTPAAPGLNRGLIDLFGVSCDDAACVAVGSFDTIVRSTDGGATWSAIASPAAKPMGNELHAVDCPGSGFCVGVGSYGHTLVSHDSGASWTEVQPSTPYSLNGVSCSSAPDCVAVGSAGTVLRTSDGSQTWSAFDSGTLGYLSSVSCPGAGYCTAVGQNGLTLVSQDDGATWSRSDTGVDDGLDAVACQSPTACTATGSNGAVLRTGDAGQSWAAVGTGTERALNGVACVGTVVCHAVGESAAVLEVADKLPVAAPDMTIADVAVNEGDSGLSTAPVTVSLSTPVPTGHEIDVSYATHPGTATAGEDYESVSGRLRFLQGESQKTISVPIIGDTVDEPDEDLTVVLSNLDGAFLARNAALVTIQNDDPTPPGDQSQPPAAGSGQTGSAGGAPAASESNPLSPPAVGGVLGLYAVSPPCKVPRLAGRRLVPALRLLSRTHCTIGRVAQRRSGRRAGIVIRQSPRRGAVRPGGTRVSLIVSSGRHK